MSKKFPKTTPPFPLKKCERKALKLARKMIKDKSQTYICVALSESCKAMQQQELIDEHTHVCQRLRAHVEESLDGNVYLGDWQRENDIKRSPKKQRKDRVAWINHMLKN